MEGCGGIPRENSDMFFLRRASRHSCYTKKGRHSPGEFGVVSTHGMMVYDPGVAVTIEVQLGWAAQ